MKTIIGITIIIGLTSCGITNTLTDEQLNQRNKIDFELNKAYNEYQFKTDSLIIEYYKIK